MFVMTSILDTWNWKCFNTFFVKHCGEIYILNFLVMATINNTSWEWICHLIKYITKGKDLRCKWGKLIVTNWEKMYNFTCPKSLLLPQHVWLRGETFLIWYYFYERITNEILRAFTSRLYAISVCCYPGRIVKCETRSRSIG